MKLQKVILKDKEAYTDRPNAHMEAIDLDKEYEAFHKKFQKGFSRTIEFTDYLSYKLYPKVFEDAHSRFKLYGNIASVPTKNFFYGMQLGEETLVELAPGKTILVKLLSVGHADEKGIKTVFFKVNGQTRFVDIQDKSLNIVKVENTKADVSNSKEIGAPLQGMLSKILVKKGQKVAKNEPLFVIEAMKMETNVAAMEDSTIASIELKTGSMVGQDDLILTLV